MGAGYHPSRGQFKIDIEKISLGLSRQCRSYPILTPRVESSFAGSFGERQLTVLVVEVWKQERKFVEMASIVPWAFWTANGLGGLMLAVAIGIAQSQPLGSMGRLLS